MPRRAAPRYTAADLARLAGVSERTVRYYVQEQLIDPPEGRGRGAHFDDRHLTQLRRVRLLQEAGLDHDAIRQYAEELEQVLAKRGFRLEDAEHAWAGFAVQAAQAHRALAGNRGRTIETSTVTRLGIASGIELLVASPRRLPPPARLAEVARYLRAAFGIDDEDDGNGGR
jgi:DNA-binding transcriptional MerR regulator